MIKKRGVRSGPIMFLDADTDYEVYKRFEAGPHLCSDKETRRDDNASLQAGGLLRERMGSVTQEHDV